MSVVTLQLTGWFVSGQDARQPMQPVPDNRDASRAPPMFGALYYAEHGYVGRYLRRLGVLTHDLADVTQEVFVVVYKKLHTYDSEKPLRPWLFGIAYKVAGHYFRTKGRDRNAMQTLEAMPRRSDDITSHDRSLLEQALQLLNDEQRAVFVMAELEEMSMPEIADAIAIPVNTAYSRLRLAREKFAAFATRVEKETQ